MAKKKKSTTPKKQVFNQNPFSHLKGFAVSGEDVEKKQKVELRESVKEETLASFADEMALLGVERITTSEPGDEELLPDRPVVDEVPQAEVASEEEQFLQAMGELQVDFSENLPEEEQPPAASARRMKQLKQGKLIPEASLDLHGLKRADVAEKVRFFLQNADHQGLQTLLVVTGRGLHSADGEPVLRNEAERYLADVGRKWVAEWGRAPKQYGGDGALVLFLRKKTR